MVTPNRPSSRICSTTASGNLSSWSCSSAMGITCSSTNCRTISVIARCSSVFSLYGVATAKSDSLTSLTRESVYPPSPRGKPLHGGFDRAQLVRVGDRLAAQRAIRSHGVRAHARQRWRVGVDRHGRRVGLLAHPVHVRRVEVEYAARTVVKL